MGIVYIYTFPNGKKYVGQTTQTIEKRAGKDGINYKSSPLVYAAIQKYGWDSIQKEIFNCSSGEEMDALEVDLISSLKTTDKNFGYNLESGGHRNKHLASQTKQKIGDANRGRYVSKETREKLRQSHLGEKNPNFGKHLSEETKKKMSLSKPNAKPVICLETKQIYPSAGMAAKNIGLKNGTHIQECCNKTRGTKTAKGYHWMWLDDYQK